MEVSFEIKEEIRKSQAELKKAIRVHQVWVARLEGDKNSSLLQQKVEEAEQNIVCVSQKQKNIFCKLRKELKHFQQSQREKKLHVNPHNDNQLIALQLRDHIAQYKNRELGITPSSYKINGSSKESMQNGNYHGSVMERRHNFTNALSKAKEAFIDKKLKSEIESWQDKAACAGGPSPPPSLTPSPTPSPELRVSPTSVQKIGEPITQELFLRMIGLVTPEQKDLLEKKLNERKKRCTTSTNRNEFVYGGFDNKRKKYSTYSYLQSSGTPPQTRLQKLRKQTKNSSDNNGSREGSPSSGENKDSNSWTLNLPKSLTVEPIYSGGRRSVCTQCGAEETEKCACRMAKKMLYREKLAERNMLKERNRQLCLELRKLEARANNLKGSLSKHATDKRELLESQMCTQRNLQKLLDFVGQFKDTSVSIMTSSGSESSENQQSRT